MICLLMRSRTVYNTIAKQQNIVAAYAKSREFSIDRVEVDSSLPNADLLERADLLDFLHSTKENDKILVDDLWVLSSKIGELVKIFECLLKKGVEVHICSQNIVISKDIALIELLGILCQQREKNLSTTQEKSLGRPKGSQSKSKFDPYRAQILKMLSEGVSVFAIAKDLEVSRSSLKDYINSRNLKDIANGIELEGGVISSTIPLSDKCHLQSEKEYYEHG